MSSSRPTASHRRQSSIGNIFRRFSTAIRSNSSRAQPVVQSSHASQLPSRQQSNDLLRRTASNDARIQRAAHSDTQVQHSPIVAPPEEPSTRPVAASRTRTAPVASGLVPVTTPGITRIRRTCHLCGNLYIRTERICQDCNHQLCSRCPRDPPAIQRMSSAPPGEDLHAEPHPVPEEIVVDPVESQENEEPPINFLNIKRTSSRRPLKPLDDASSQAHRLREWKKPRHRIRYLCDICGATFGEKSRVCAREGCGHRRCEKCPREPPRRCVDPEHDPEILRKLDARMAAYVVVQSATAAAAATTQAASVAAAAVDAEPISAATASIEPGLDDPQETMPVGAV